MKAAHHQTLTYMTLGNRHNRRDRNQVTRGHEVEKGHQLQRRREFGIILVMVWFPNSICHNL